MLYIYQVQNHENFMDFMDKIWKMGFPLPPILPAIGTPTYMLPKLCDKLLKPIASNKLTIKYLFLFGTEVEDD